MADQSKTERATPRRRQKARERGQVARSRDLIAGLAAAAALTQLMKSLLFGVSPIDPLTYAAIPIVLAACAVVASYLPARRAASIDPVVALRAE